MINKDYFKDIDLKNVLTNVNFIHNFVFSNGKNKIALFKKIEDNEIWSKFKKEEETDFNLKLINYRMSQFKLNQADFN